MTEYTIEARDDSLVLPERVATHLKGVIFDTAGAPLAGDREFFAEGWRKQPHTNVLYRRFDKWTLKLCEVDGYAIEVWGERRAWILVPAANHELYFICPRLDLAQAIAVTAFEALLESGIPAGSCCLRPAHRIISGLAWIEFT